MPSIAVVANRKKFGKRARGELRAALAAAGLDGVAWIDVKRGSDAERAAKRAVKGGARTVIACGGDGTVRAVAEALVDTETAVAVMPAGTSNLFATGLGLPSAASDVVQLIVGGEHRTIDTGRCNGMTFSVMGGTGLDAGMIAGAAVDKERLGTLAYVRAGVREARQRAPVAARVTIDGRLFHDGAATCVLVGNLGTLKGGVVAFPDASPNDGVLDVAVVTAGGVGGRDAQRGTQAPAPLAARPDREGA